MTAKDKTLCLIDGSGYIFRAFYALPPMSRPDGVSVNAVYGFTNMMMNIIRDNPGSHLVVVFDAARKNFRNLIYPEYKANRRDPPPELIPQFPLIREACDALNVARIEMEGYEADDLIATYARLATEQGWHTTVISADKDLMQLMNDHVSVYDPMKKKMLGEKDVFDKFGVTPDKVIEVQALMGDSTDNIPGANGVGPKTAAELINQFGSVNNLLLHLDDIKSDKRREGLKRDIEQIKLSKQLVELDTKVPVVKDFHDFVASPYQPDTLLAFLQQNNFQSLIKKVNTKSNVSQPPKESETSKQYSLIKTEEQLKQFLRQMTGSVLVIDPLINATNNAVGVALCIGNGKAGYISFCKGETTPAPDLFSWAEQAQTGSLTQQHTIQIIQSIFNSKERTSVAHNIKNVAHALDLKTFPIAFEDIELMSYEIDGSKHGHALEELSNLILHKKILTQDELCGSGKNKQLVTDLPIEQVVPYMCERADVIFSLYHYFAQSLRNNDKQQEIYQDIDKPLIPILFDMEVKGVLVDKKQLAQLDVLFTNQINNLIDQIYIEAGTEFNINSTVQLGEILYEKRGLSGGKRGPNGHWVTDVKALETLAENGDKLSNLILQYRSLTKLKSTYIEAFINLLQQSPRIHTTFSLTNTNTGRLASSNPNLQNIPIRSEEGKEIRRSFIANPGYQLLAADYSQIELRLMAHVAGVHKLKESFEHGEDIHARTASQVLHIPLEQITQDQRRRAKAINFGIIYGISPFGLAANLGISRQEAKDYIDTYFEQYPEIKEYMSRIQDFAEKNGYVETPFGRKVYLPGLNNKATKSFALRAAINAPIQGGAADIIKMAMIRATLALKQANLDCTLILQVHDELVFEVAPQDIPKAKELIKDAMEHVVKLDVPLIADINTGDNWKEAH